MAKKARASPPESEGGADTPPPMYPGNGQMLKIPRMYLLRARLERYLQTDRQWLRDMLGEFLGTTLLVCIICGNAAQAVLSRGKAAGKFFPTSFVTGMGITFGAYISGNTSGGHINPAVTMVMVLVGRTTWRMLPLYWIAQYGGAFVGAAVVYGVYYDALNNYDGGVRQVFGANATAGIFATYPQSYLSTGFGWFDQVVGTAILTMCIFAVHDERNVEVPSYLLPLIVGLVVCLIGMAFGWNCGAPINPARDLGPRIFTYIAGWGRNVFRYRYYNWFWATLVGPHMGAVLGTILYMLFVGIHWPLTFDRGYQVTRKASVAVLPVMPARSGASSRKISFAALPPSTSAHRAMSITSIPEIRVEPESPRPMIRQTSRGKLRDPYDGNEIKVILPLSEDPNEESEAAKQAIEDKSQTTKM